MSEETKAKPCEGIDLSAAITAALDPQRLQGVVESKLSEAMDRWVTDALTGYNNPIRAAFTRRMEEAIVPAIERLSLDNARLDVLLSTFAQQNAIGERAEILGKFGKLVTGERRYVVPASELFEEWKSMVARDFDCTGREVVTGDGDPYYEWIECSCELVEGHDNGYLGTRKVANITFCLTGEDEDQQDKYGRSIAVYRWEDLPRNEDEWFVSFPPHPTLKSIAHMDAFDILLARLDSCGTHVLWDLGYGTSDEIEPEAHPEPDWT